MVFSDPTFLFLFLPPLFAVYFLVPRSLRNPVLLVASLVFYAWDERVWVLIMLGSILFNYTVGRLIERRRQRQAKQADTRPFVALAVVGNLGALIAFKYANFLADNIDVALAACGLPTIQLSPVHLPIGISFFTFQALSYVVDVHRGHAEVQRNPVKLALYISLFPQLIAGPIVRYAAVADQISRRVVGAERFAYGVERFAIGLAKKTMVANPSGERADTIFALAAGDLSPSVAWLGLLCYSIQIYFDFSGYSDMAIGLGRMFGFEFAENFNYPYISRSITEFWRRWHISLSSWFRDYLYIPLGGNRVPPARMYFNLVLVFVLCGFWHGASWNFLIWGLLHGALLVVERLGFGKVLAKSPGLFSRGYVLLMVMLTWVFFRADTLPGSVEYVRALIGVSSTAPNAQPFGFFLDTQLALVLVAGVIGSTPWVPWARRRWGEQIPRVVGDPFGVLVIALLLGLSVLLMAAGTYNPFIYFRF